MVFHCFFEQSGTFKNEFKKLGYEAYDYDILNDFGETDYQVDLFKDIEEAYTHTHTHEQYSTTCKKAIRSLRSFLAPGSKTKSICGSEDKQTDRRTWMLKKNWSIA